MSVMRFLFLFFFTGIAFGQQLHRQMLSARGKVATTSKGIVVSQTFAQQSTIGTSIKGKMIVSQDFQQSKSSSAVPKKPIENKTTVFPNPITDQVNFKMDHPVPGKIYFSLFDIHGRLLEHQEKEAPDQPLTINNLMLDAGEYFVKLEGPNYSFGTAILKSN